MVICGSGYGKEGRERTGGFRALGRKRPLSCQCSINGGRLKWWGAKECPTLTCDACLIIMAPVYLRVGVFGNPEPVQSYPRLGLLRELDPILDLGSRTASRKRRWSVKAEASSSHPNCPFGLHSKKIIRFPSRIKSSRP
jgi:hypothetical protein